jgi:hypothetical protein
LIAKGKNALIADGYHATSDDFELRGSREIPRLTSRCMVCWSASGRRNYVTATSTIGFVACNDRQQTMSMDYSPDIFLDHTHSQAITGSSAQKR